MPHPQILVVATEESVLTVNGGQFFNLPTISPVGNVEEWLNSNMGGQLESPTITHVTTLNSHFEHSRHGCPVILVQLVLGSEKHAVYGANLIWQEHAKLSSKTMLPLHAVAYLNACSRLTYQTASAAGAANLAESINLSVSVQTLLQNDLWPTMNTDDMDCPARTVSAIVTSRWGAATWSHLSDIAFVYMYARRAVDNFVCDLMIRRRDIHVGDSFYKNLCNINFRTAASSSATRIYFGNQHHHELMEEFRNRHSKDYDDFMAAIIMQYNAKEMYDNYVKSLPNRPSRKPIIPTGAENALITTR